MNRNGIMNSVLEEIGSYSIKDESGRLLENFHSYMRILKI